MASILDDRFADDIKAEVLTMTDEVTSEQLIPGLVAAILALASEFPSPGVVLDEVFRLLEEEDVS